MNSHLILLLLDYIDEKIMELRLNVETDEYFAGNPKAQRLRATIESIAKAEMHERAGK